MKTRYIKDLKNGDLLNDELFRVDKYELHNTKTGSAYIQVILTDKTGKLDSKIWSNFIPMCAEAKPGDIVRVNGSVDLFNNNLQGKISKLRVESEFDISDFVQSSSRPSEDIFSDIMSFVERMENIHLKTFLKTQFSNEEFKKKFLRFPAAKSMHHAYIGGLSEHVLDMLLMSSNVLANHPLANKDIVYTGIILHDIGKLVEFEEVSPFVFDYSLKGNMLGHIFIGATWFNDNLPENFPEDLRLRMTHVILSHHGKLEFGSPVTPKTYEAIIVNKLDDMSANLNKVMGTYESYNGVSDFSERIPSLNGDMLYLRPFSEQNQ